MKTSAANKSIRAEKGQSLVEMAIMLAVLLTILAGVLDLGRLYFTYIALQNAAGEGATYGSMFPTRHYAPGCANPDYCPNEASDPNNVVYRAQHESPNNLVEWLNTTVTVELLNLSTAAGSPVEVAMEYEYEVMTPVIKVIAGDTITLRAAATNTIIGTD